MTNESQILADFQFSCQLIYQCLHQTPDTVFLEQLKALVSDEQESPNEHIEAGLKLINKGLDSISTEAVATDYAQLFIGPDTLKAAPWASVYLTEDQTLCGQPTQAVKAFYREHGLEIDTGTHEPEDHLGLMFAFMADRLARMVHALDGNSLDDNSLDDNTLNNSASIDADMTCLQTFLSEYVLTWAPRFLEVMHDNASTDVYRGISLLTKGSLEQLAALTEAEYRIIRLYR